MANWRAACDEFLSSSEPPSKTKAQLKKSLEIVKEAYEKYQPDQIAMSFNGGKDCLVMLIIILAVWPAPPHLSIYIRTPNSFKEVDEFVEECAQKYHLELTTSEQPMRDALQGYLDDNEEVRAIFVGIRRADPYAEHLQYFQPTDHGWPKFMRIHPVIDWHYDDVWVFLRHLRVPYCCLYDHGYTSLGSVPTTIKNPSLINADGSFRPAYELADNDKERIGRNIKRE